MTLTPTRTSTPLPDPYPWTYAHPSPLTTARVQAEEEHQAARQQEAAARTTWTEFDAMMAALAASLTVSEERLQDIERRLEKCREDLSHLWRSS